MGNGEIFSGTRIWVLLLLVLIGLGEIGNIAGADALAASTYVGAEPIQACRTQPRNNDHLGVPASRNAYAVGNSLLAYHQQQVGVRPTVGLRIAAFHAVTTDLRTNGDTDSLHVAHQPNDPARDLFEFPELHATRGGGMPGRLARVIPGDVTPAALGRPGTADVFVTAADDIAGMTSPAQIAERLTVPQSKSFTVIEFATPAEGLASPVFRTNPGFIGGGRTAGGAREFVVPNMSIPPGATVRRVGP